MGPKRVPNVRDRKPANRVRRFPPRKSAKNPLSFEDFYLPFGGKLKGNNRWVRLAYLIPWDLVDEIYEKNFAASNRGAPAKPSRMAFGALITKERVSVRLTVMS